jgi:hypothetical protein
MLYDARIVYNASGDMVRPPSSPEYVGEPTPEMDLAWKQILPGMSGNLRKTLVVKRISNDGIKPSPFGSLPKKRSSFRVEVSFTIPNLTCTEGSKRYLGLQA